MAANIHNETKVIEETGETNVTQKLLISTIKDQ